MEDPLFVVETIVIILGITVGVVLAIDGSTRGLLWFIATMVLFGVGDKTKAIIVLAILYLIIGLIIATISYRQIRRLSVYQQLVERLGYYSPTTITGFILIVVFWIVMLWVDTDISEKSKNNCLASIK